MTETPCLSTVATLVRDTAQAEIMPYWRNLGAGDVREKTPGDPVTVADEACERALRTGLREIDPDAAILGEEDPDNHARLMRDLQDGAATWVIDPLDGTRPFAAGETGWGVQVAYCRNGVALAGWLHDPVRGLTLAGDRGMTWLHTKLDPNFGRTTILTPSAAAATNRVALLDGYGRTEATDRARGAAGRMGLELRAPSMAGIWVALEVAAGRIDAGMCTMMRPWDFLPIAGALRAAGAVVRPLDTAHFDLSGAGNSVLISRTRAFADRWHPPVAA